MTLRSLIGLPTAGVLTALLVAAGVSPWAIAAIAAAGAAFGGVGADRYNGHLCLF